MRKAIIQYPKSEPSADSLGEVDADDGSRYYIKADEHGRPIRASEWISTHLAEAVGIATPAPTAVELKDGSTVFGSRRVAGVADTAITRAYVLSSSNRNAPIIGMAALLSRIYAFDMFIQNDDRHFGNYISVDDRGVRRLYAYDFSRALFWQWPWTGFVPSGCNTMQCGRQIRALHGFDQSAAASVLDQLASMPASAVEDFIKRMPSDWLSPKLQGEIIDLFANGGSKQRVSNLYKGFSDGSLL